jgi:iron(III) transport system substrate-binding protein
VLLSAFAGGAFAAGSVVVYNATNPKLVAKVIETFKAQNPGIDVEVINAGVGELLTRIKTERNNPRGDVFFGASVEAYDSSVELFAPYQSKEDPNFDRDVVASGKQYYGFSMPLQAFIVNTKLLPETQAPKSWSDLGDSSYKGQIVMANPALSGSAYAQLAQMLQLHGWDLVKKVIDNTTFVTSSKLVYQNVAKGEVAVGITGDYNVVKMRDQGYPVVAIYPAEGTGLRFDANGIIKGGPNLENAKLFVDFANSREAHEIMVGMRNRRSVREDVSAPKGQIPTAEVPTFPYDPKKAAADRQANLEKFDELFSAK